MTRLAGTDIRDFRIRGSYINQRSLLARQNLHYSKRADLPPNLPGYSPPVVEFELADGATSSIHVGETDVALLSDNDVDKAKRHLCLILNARAGDREALQQLSSGAEARPALAAVSARESRFVVPSTSAERHSEHEISQKGSILLKLSQQGYPVPDFVVLTANAYTDGAPRLEHHLADALQQLENLTMQRLGGGEGPLVFAIRCATAQYIPGVMDTYLNVGVTERTLPCLETTYGPLAARKMFLNNLRNLCEAVDPDNAATLRAGRSGLPSEEVASLIDELSAVIRRSEPSLLDDPFAQAAFFARQAYSNFDENHELVLTLCRGTEHYPSLILQKMICTVRHDEAYAGVLSSRHTQTGVGFELQTAHNIFGEEMMTGTAEIESTAFEDPERIRQAFPAVYHFLPRLPELEREFESPVTIEFAVEATGRSQSFALLQLNETGMSGRAAIISVVDLHKSGVISRQRVTELVRPYHIKQLTSDTISQENFELLKPFCAGMTVLPRSAISARLFFSGDAALSARSRGERVCLCQKTFIPTDTVVMREMDAILSLTSAAVHVVTICQSLGIPALLSLEKNGVALLLAGGLVNASGRAVREGDWVTISSRRRTLYEGQAKFQPARLLRYMKGEQVEMDEDERRTFAAIAYAYRYYQQLTRAMEVDQISTLSEVTRLVNFDLRTDSQEAQQLVNGWFDERETVYMEEVLKSDIGDHLGQSNVFEMLTLNRKIRFFKRALAKCRAERIFGYEAGAFMLGRFLCLRYPVGFWKCFSPADIGLLVNEWVLFQKYMQVLQKVGERKVLQARKTILRNGLDELALHPGVVQALIRLKLSGAPLEQAKDSLPEWSDPQSARVLEVLQQPYRAFYDFNAPWSVGQLRKICEEEKLPLPEADGK